MAALNIIRQLGAHVVQSGSTIEVQSSGKPGAATEIDCGESGLSARLFTPIAAIADHWVRINGRGSLLRRPMDALGSVLPSLGVSLQDFTGTVPFSLRGPLRPGHITLDGSMSSQFLSGLLFALTFNTDETTIVRVHNLKSKPYIDLTLQVLETFGKKIRHSDYHEFEIDPSGFHTVPEVDVTVEGDWSSAAFWAVGAAVSGNLQLDGIARDSVQADRAVLDVLAQSGCAAVYSNGTLALQSPDTLRSFCFNAIDAPDLFPVLSVLAACCRGESRIAGLHRLQHKESDRRQSICLMLERFGVSWRIEGDELVISGREILNGGEIDGSGDHRIVMAAAIGALRAANPVLISSAESIGKSYPLFFQHLSSLGINLRLQS